MKRLFGILMSAIVVGVFALVLIQNHSNSSMIASTAPPDPEFIKVASTVPPDPDYITVSKTLV